MVVAARDMVVAGSRAAMGGARLKTGFAQRWEWGRSAGWDKGEGSGRSEGEERGGHPLFPAIRGREQEGEG